MMAHISKSLLSTCKGYASQATDLVTDVVDSDIPKDVHEAHARYTRLEIALEKLEALEAILVGILDSIDDTNSPKTES